MMNKLQKVQDLSFLIIEFIINRASQCVKLLISLVQNLINASQQLYLAKSFFDLLNLSERIALLTFVVIIYDIKESLNVIVEEGKAFLYKLINDHLNLAL